MKRQDVNVQVVNVIERQPNGSWFGLLMLIGLVIWLWKFFLLVAILTIIVVICVSVYRKTQRDQEAILQRADQQHQWVMEGDPRGTYGDSMAFRNTASKSSSPPKYVSPHKPPMPMPKPAHQRIRIVGGETIERHS